MKRPSDIHRQLTTNIYTAAVETSAHELVASMAVAERTTRGVNVERHGIVMDEVQERLTSG